MITFRTAETADVTALYRLINSAYRGEYSRQGWTTEADLVAGERVTEDVLRKIISTSNEEIDLALENDQVVGCVHLTWNAEHVYFGMLTVAPTAQASGLGKLLLAELESKAKARGIHRVRLSVLHVRDTLIAYYKRRGFIETGHSEPFPEEYLPKISGLRLIEFEKILIP